MKVLKVLASFPGRFREEKRPGHYCWRMRVVPIKTWEFVHVRILSVYFPVVCPYMIVILTSGRMALYETCRDFAVEYSLMSLI